MVEQTSGYVFLPEDPEAFSYDDDGNLLSDGRWEYTWDGENRLEKMETHATLSSMVPRRQLEFVYDYMGRRVQKKVSSWTGSAWSQIEDIRFVYSGWNMIAELDGSQNLTKSYLWGLDISQTLTGAGGVGGLLAIHEHGSGGGTYLVVTDEKSGNVAALVDTADPSYSAAEYEYDPFGKLIHISGVAAGVSPFRFSTKYQDSESGHYCYGYRYYNADTGRWLNRDPIEEQGGLNLYGFVGNNPVNAWDYLGLLSDFGVALAIFRHWDGWNGNKAFIREGGKWGQFFMEYPIVKEEASASYLREAERVWRNGSDSGESYFRKAIPFNRSRPLKMALHWARYIIRGSYRVDRQCGVVYFTRNEHAILDEGDFHNDKDWIDVAGNAIRALGSKMPVYATRKPNQNFFITIKWRISDFSLNINSQSGSADRRSASLWPFD